MQNKIDYVNVSDYDFLYLDATARLLKQLKTEFKAISENTSDILMEVTHNSITKSPDSSLETLVIHITSKKDFEHFEEAIEKQIDALDKLSKTAIDFFKDELKDFAYCTTLRNGFQTLITGYIDENKSLSSNFASVLYTDETLYITYITYPQ